MVDVWKIDGVCLACRGSGWKILHRQGDLVEDVEQRSWSRTVYAATEYVSCDCMKWTSMQVYPPWEPGTGGGK